MKRAGTEFAEVFSEEFAAFRTDADALLLCNYQELETQNFGGEQFLFVTHSEEIDCLLYEVDPKTQDSEKYYQADKIIGFPWCGISKDPVINSIFSEEESGYQWIVTAILSNDPIKAYTQCACTRFYGTEGSNIAFKFNSESLVDSLSGSEVLPGSLINSDSITEVINNSDSYAGKFIDNESSSEIYITSELFTGRLLNSTSNTAADNSSQLFAGKIANAESGAGSVNNSTSYTGMVIDADSITQSIVESSLNQGVTIAGDSSAESSNISFVLVGILAESDSDTASFNISDVEIEGELVEEDDFTGEDGSDPVYWDVESDDPEATSLIYNNKLRHTIPSSTPFYTGVSSKFIGAVFPGDGIWSIQIDFEIIQYWFSTQNIAPVNFMVRPSDGTPGYHGISILCKYNEYPYLTVVSRSSVSGEGNDNNVSAPVSGTLQISASGGDLTLSYPGISWSVLLTDELDPTKNYSVFLTTNRTNAIAAGDPNIITDYDNFTSTGGQ